MDRLIRGGRRLSGRIMGRLRHYRSRLARPDEMEILLGKLKEAPPAEGIAGRVVVITGGSRGIGFALARKFAAERAKVVVNGRSRTALDRAVGEIRGAGGTVHGVQADVATKEGAQRLLQETLSAYGAVDILINNAGVPGPGGRRAWDVSAEEWAETLGANLNGPFYCASAVIGWMIRNGVKGRIINVSSGAGQSAYPGIAPYGVSKSALEGLSRCLAIDLGTDGIAVTTVALGSVRTEMTKAAFPWEVYQGLPPPESVVPVFLFAATAPSGLVHGRTLAAWRFEKDAFAESMLNGPVAMAPRLSFEPLRKDGREIRRNADGITVFDRAENQFGMPPGARRAVKDALDKMPLHQYPDMDYGRLRKALSGHLNLPEDCFTFGNGSSELVERLLRVFVHAGEEVVSNNPGWFVFDRFCLMQGIVNRKVPFSNPGRAGQTHHNLDGVLDAIGVNTRMIYLVNPSNPLGVGIRAGDFERFLRQVPPGLPVVVDEAYIEFSDNPETLRAPAIVLSAGRNLIGLRTFSKFYGLAGFRVGYAFAAPNMIHLIDRLELTFNLPWLSEAAAVGALEDTAHNAETFENVRRERRFIEDSCRDMGLDFLPSEIHLMFVESPCAPLKYYEAFEKEGIYLPKSDYFAGKYLVFPIGTPRQNRKNVDVLRALLHGGGK